LIAVVHPRSSRSFVGHDAITAIARSVEIVSLFLRAAIVPAREAAARTARTVRRGVGLHRWLVFVFFAHKCRDWFSFAAGAALPPFKRAALLHRQFRQQFVGNI
jgi:hypothetical protein